MIPSFNSLLFNLNRSNFSPKIVKALFALYINPYGDDLTTILSHYFSLVKLIFGFEN